MGRGTLGDRAQSQSWQTERRRVIPMCSVSTTRETTVSRVFDTKQRGKWGNNLTTGSCQLAPLNRWLIADWWQLRGCGPRPWSGFSCYKLKEQHTQEEISCGSLFFFLSFLSVGHRSFPKRLGNSCTQWSIYMERKEMQVAEGRNGGNWPINFQSG